ncbi:fragment of pimeloyl-CoA synthetase (part 4) [Candidatus Kuenenia stuttgartiensis]|uniref:Fragment of pimeloyl-CoA synthetase (Part 4) n=1 Tax=Kuenenia stuttgartiensis TaxID=174633 RepID=A0A2C9CD06_KUEST|nr:acetate--CoA ligase family protein [Candidatus Kuenenia stuttgartiensis]SOH03463.1 fragment of pimeloyl-CoA synthetase (part 4) [Candidatus Kuenenia stuttgartiensis]
MPEADLKGIMVQQMITGGRELVLGVSHEPQFGHLIMFGLGGIYVEALKDVTFRIAPVGINEAREMIQEIRAFPLLKGVRGEKSVDIDAIVENILRLSQLVKDFPEIIEMDINPLVVFPKATAPLQ